MKNKEDKEDESVDSFNDIGDFCTYWEGDFERIFYRSTYVHRILFVREKGRLRFRF